MDNQLGDVSEPPAKRRKVRKGTRSCWECRRRKIKCQFDSPDDATCIGCKQRGTTCRSQEFDDENAPEPGHKSDPPLARRLDRLEQMMERLVDRIVPEESDAPEPGASQRHQVRRSRSSSAHDAPNAEPPEPSVDAATGGDGPIAALLAMRHESAHRRGPSESGHIPTPALTSVESLTPTLPATATTQVTASRPPTSAGDQSLPSAKHLWVCTSLRSVMPSQSALNAIVAASPGAFYIADMLYSEAERLRGVSRPSSSMTIIPPVSSHPLILARRALQILICVQQLPSAFDWDSLGLGNTRIEVMARLASTATLVTSNDDLMGYMEGIECLILQGFYQVNCGSLRKAWMSCRRGINLAQMMGIDKGRFSAFRACEVKASPVHRTSAEGLWYRLVFWERYSSLILGFPIGSYDDDFASDKACRGDSAVERLEKMHTVLSARLIERNNLHHKDLGRHQASYALTQEIDLEVEAAASLMPSDWWEEPHLDHFASQEVLLAATARMVLQIHHFTLVILLHAPYMLRDLTSPRYDYSKTTCMASARELLNRFFSFRSYDISACSCRRVDYAGLIAAMTLCLSYLGKRRGETWQRERAREDEELIEATRRRLDHIAGANGDRLSKYAAGIITQLAPIIDKAATTLEEAAGVATTNRPGDIKEELRFNVPYLGSVNIKMPTSSNILASMSPDWHGHRRHPSSATGALERMMISPTQQVHRSSEFSQPLSDSVCIQVSPVGGQNDPWSGTDSGSEPDFIADGEDWALQGVDAAYWSLFVGIK